MATLFLYLREIFMNKSLQTTPACYVHFFPVYSG
jgi:hypothetical protein